MTDIVERLRRYKRDRSGYAEYCHQAADEIERLKAGLAAETQRRWDGNRIASAEAAEELAECQAREAKLRTALEMYLMPMPDKDTTVMAILIAATETAMQALALPTDNTALKEAIKQAKRDVLLEAAEKFCTMDSAEADWEGEWASDHLRRMAEEIK